MQLLVDTREHKLFPLLDAKGVKYKTESLDVGDIQIIKNIQQEDDDEDGNQITVPLMIIERKTLADLAASIKDGRYKEQKIRIKQLQQLHPELQVTYIIEGVLHYDDSMTQYGLSSKAINTALFSMQFKDDITVITTQNLNTTCNVVSTIFTRYLDGKADEWNNHLQLVSETDSHAKHQEVLIKQKKKENTSSTDSVLLAQLSAIPGISYKKASVLVKELEIKSIGQLCQRLSQSKNAVAEMQKVKGIGKTLAQQIVESICGKEN